MPIILTGHINVPVDEIQAIKDALVIHTKLSRQEPDCIAFDVTQDEVDPTCFHVYEEFSTRAGFEKHQQRVKASDWGGITSNVTRHYQVSEK